MEGGWILKARPGHGARGLHLSPGPSALALDLDLKGQDSGLSLAGSISERPGRKQGPRTSRPQLGLFGALA